MTFGCLMPRSCIRRRASSIMVQPTRSSQAFAAKRVVPNLVNGLHGATRLPGAIPMACASSLLRAPTFIARKHACGVLRSVGMLVDETAHSRNRALCRHDLPALVNQRLIE